MTNKKRILIAEESGDFLKQLTAALRTYGFECFTVPKDGAQLLKSVESCQPDLLLTDAFLSHFDAIAVMGLLAAEAGKRRPMTAVMSNVAGGAFEQQVLAAGASYYFIKPCDPEIVAQRLAQLADFGAQADPVVSRRAVRPENDLEITVSEIMRQIGVPAHIKGYQYLRSSIVRAVETPSVMSSVTKILYPTVAEEFGTTASRVERAIRHAIEVAWDRGDIDVLGSYFGYTIQTSRGKPTNSEFIAMISDKIRLNMKKIS